MILRSTLLALCLLVPTAAFAEDPQPHAMPGMAMDSAKSPATAEYMKAMDAMSKDMQAMQPTGDPSMDFVMMMKPHHQAAVEMAKAYLQHGKDPMLTKMAQDIVRSQTEEIAAMDKWRAKHGM